MNDTNKNKRYIENVVIDLVISKHVIRYRYYPDEFGKYNIPKCHTKMFNMVIMLKQYV